jgi:hypothetical protein
VLPPDGDKELAMTTTIDYRQFALDCLHWAEDAKDVDHRVTLIRLAHMWMLTASELDRRVPPDARPRMSGTLRAKLD